MSNWDVALIPKSFPKLIISIAVCQGAGLIGSLFTFSAISSWYVYLQKPNFSPPNFVFGPVWTILYTLMGIALYLVWIKGLKKKGVRFAVKVFLIHLGVNALWSIVFFGLKDIFGALIVIGILWLMIVWSMILFCKIDRRATWLLAPYLAWVTFASALNYGIWVLNK